MQTLVEIPVGGGQGGLGPLHQQAAHGLLQQPEEDLPLPAHPILRGVDRGGVALAGENLRRLVEDGGKDVVVHEGGHHRDLPGRGAGGQAGGVGPAALPAVDQPLLLQQAEGVADGLAAELIAGRQLQLRRQLVPLLSAAPAQLLPQTVRQDPVFCGHISASFRWFFLGLFYYIIWRAKICLL